MASCLLSAQPPVRTPVWRLALLLILLLPARLIALDHPAPVLADDQRFALGVVYLAHRIATSAALPRDSQLELTRSYPVHHPGYPLWITLALPLYLLGLSPWTALTCWSVLASLIEPLILYGFAARLMRPSLAWWIALAYGLAPVYWFLSVTALNYVAGSAVGLGVASWAWLALVDTRPSSAGVGGSITMQPTSDARRRPLLAAVALCALGAGVRPDLLLWFGPLLVYVAARHRSRDALFVIAALMFAGMVWTLVTSWFYAGNVADPTAPRLQHTWTKVMATSAFNLGLKDGLLRNAVKLAADVGWGLGAAALLLAVAIVPAVRRLCQSDRRTLIFLLVWFLPPFIFNLLIHMTEAGHAIWHFSILYLLMGIGLEQIMPRRSIWLAAGVAFAGTAQFLVYPWNADSRGFKGLLDRKVAFMSWSGLRQIDRRAAVNRPGDFWPTRAHEIPD